MSFRSALCALCVLCFSLSAEEPWGTDASLRIPPSPKDHSPSLLSSLGQAAIRFHQEVISPADGPRSHFFPSSSQYALESIRKYGLLQGVAMGCDRLMRENSDDWVYRIILIPEPKYGIRNRVLKYDPVP